MNIEIKPSLIAPCGMNCASCMNYLRERNKCPRCRGSDTDKWVIRIRCKIKNCEFFNNTATKFCFGCMEYPCEKLKHLDKSCNLGACKCCYSNMDNLKKTRIYSDLDAKKDTSLNKALTFEDPNIDGHSKQPYIDYIFNVMSTYKYLNTSKK